MIKKTYFNVEHHYGWIESGDTANDLSIHLDCCENATSSPGESIIVRLDWYYDHPTLYVWLDKEEEDPQIISLERAVIEGKETA